MKSNYKKGFTLIELLVVIAIIGILSSVVLASLNTARDKGADAAVKGNLSGVRASAELVYDNSSTYVGLFTTDNPSKNAIASADSANGSQAVGTTSSSTGWAAWANLKSTPTIAYCVDGNGYAGTTTASPTITDAAGCL